jgi:hypothetical protein
LSIIDKRSPQLERAGTVIYFTSEPYVPLRDHPGVFGYD